MDSLTYQSKLAEFDEKITFHKMKAEEMEHEKSRFVLEVLRATANDALLRSSGMPASAKILNGGKENAG